MNKKVKKKKKRQLKINFEWLNKLKKIYIGYTSRIIIFGVSFLVLIVLSLLFFYKSLSVKDEEVIQYSENGNVNYKVYLKQNEFYEEPYLVNKQVYIASLIKNIEVNFDYKFLIDELSNFDFSYDIIGKLNIFDNTNNLLYEKEYTLLSTTKEESTEQNIKDINKTITIDYDYYNSLANKFKSTYGVDTNSELVIYFNINKGVTNEDKNINLNNSNNMTLTIPLTEKTINIAINNTSINNTNRIINQRSVSISNIIFVILCIITFIASVASLLRFLELLFKTSTKKSKYDRMIKKILNEYDRLIVETPTAPNMEGKEIIKINRIEELLDARDNLKRPIMYHNVTNHTKSYFYIQNGDTYYLYVLKAVDLEV